MHDPAIDIAPEVARRIGPGNVRLARRPAHPTYLCPGSGSRGSHTEPASLVILAADGLPDVARYVHPACMPSSIRPVGPRSFRLPDDAAATSVPPSSSTSSTARPPGRPPGTAWTPR